MRQQSNIGGQTAPAAVPDMTDPEPLRRLYSRREVAEILRCHPGSVARWQRKGVLRGLKINSRVTRYRAEDVAKLIADAGV